VAVDALGGDHGPHVVIAGALAACRELGLQVRLVGPRAAVTEELRRAGGSQGGVDVVDAPDSVGMAEAVTRATLKKRSSIQVALELVRDGGADAFFSAGNTAACWTIAKLTLGTLEEVDRPALAAVVPHPTGRTVLLDVGANASCKARHLEEFAVMGKVYTASLFHTPDPRVGLMSMGHEQTKGNELTKEVHEVLKESALNFIGNVEGHDLFTGRVDVIIMDGFTGNVALKASETLAESMMTPINDPGSPAAPFDLIDINVAGFLNFASSFTMTGSNGQTQVVSSVGTTPTPFHNVTYVEFNIDQDGGIESVGLSALNVNSTPTPTPEPGSLALLGIGLAGFAAIRKRTKA
jgi:glycerol-3-phosphate acyltransferase PlsX